MIYSKIWLSKNIKLDKDYKAVLNYTENQLIQLMSNEENLVYYNNSYSFLRDTGEILVQGSYGACLQANYMAFQNPDYSNKIFFAFIDSIEYVSEKTTKIRYTIDIWATWFEYWTAQACFVLREHVTDDTVGLHTLPENVELGDYISQNIQPSEIDLDEMCFVVATSEQYLPYSFTGNQILPTGAVYVGLTTLQGIQDYIGALTQANLKDSIIAVFVAPKSMFTNWSSTLYDYIDGEVSTSVLFEYDKDINIDIPSTLGKNYVPGNKKLLTYPYTYLQVSNYSGGIANYRWENFNLFTNNTQARFEIKGTIVPAGSFYVQPIDYNNQLNIVDEVLPIGKLPIGAYTVDAWTAWFASNGVNLINKVGSEIIAGTATTALGIATANPLAIAGGAGAIGHGITTAVSSVYQAKIVPDTSEGETCIGDANYQFGRIGIAFKRMTIKNEFAMVIDDFFTRMGYSINRVKVPNMGHRQNYNYVQIASDDNCVRVNNHNNICPPSKDIESINNLFRRGITIWNNHNNLGNYLVSNNITS